VLLLHDIQPATALGISELLRELKARGYRVVHVVPRGAPPPPPLQPEVPVASAPAAAPVDARASVVQPRTPERLLTAIVPPKPQPVASPADSPPMFERVSAPRARHAAPPPEAPRAHGASAVAPPPEASPPPDEERAASVAAAAPESRPPASETYARAIPIVPGDPVRPFTSDAKPARSMPTPGKFVTTEPGGWPPVTSIPVPKAGGVGVSAITRGSAGPDGRFR
jgi:hypothetical protein